MRLMSRCFVWWSDWLLYRTIINSRVMHVYVVFVWSFMIYEAFRGVQTKQDLAMKTLSWEPNHNRQSCLASCQNVTKLLVLQFSTINNCTKSVLPTYYTYKRHNYAIVKWMNTRSRWTWLITDNTECLLKCLNPLDCEYPFSWFDSVLSSCSQRVGP